MALSCYSDANFEQLMKRAPFRRIDDPLAEFVHVPESLECGGGFLRPWNGEPVERSAPLWASCGWYFFLYHTTSAYYWPHCIQWCSASQPARSPWSFAIMFPCGGDWSTATTASTHSSNPAVTTTISLVQFLSVAWFNWTPSASCIDPAIGGVAEK